MNQELEQSTTTEQILTAAEALGAKLEAFGTASWEVLAAETQTLGITWVVLGGILCLPFALSPWWCGRLASRLFPEKIEMHKMGQRAIQGQESPMYMPKMEDVIREGDVNRADRAAQTHGAIIFSLALMILGLVVAFTSIKDAVAPNKALLAEILKSL